MSAGEPCGHPGCDRTQTIKSARGLCPMHYKRSVAGVDMDGPPRADTKATFNRLIQIQTDECVLWPHGRQSNGYGVTTSSEGRRVGVHVLALEVAAGPRPSKGHDAAHSCRNRHCMNPRHLRWATRSENSLDRHRDGTCWQAKLSIAEVIEIRRNLTRRDATQASLAAKYGVSVSTIEYIQAGKVWAHLKEAS